MKIYMIVVISADRFGNRDITDEKYVMTSEVDENVGNEIIKNIEHREIQGSNLRKDLAKIIGSD